MTGPTYADMSVVVRPLVLPQLRPRGGRRHDRGAGQLRRGGQRPCAARWSDWRRSGENRPPPPRPRARRPPSPPGGRRRPAAPAARSRRPAPARPPRSSARREPAAQEGRRTGRSVAPRHGRSRPSVSRRAKALRGHERHPGPAPLEDEVGGEGGGVGDPADLVRVDAGTGQDVAGANEHRLGRVVGRGQVLSRYQPSTGPGHHDVGERPADVDAEQCGPVPVVDHGPGH